MENYEEKLKQKIEKAKKYMSYHNDGIKECLVDIFPELKESEDERIRKELIEALKQLDREKTPVDTYPYFEWVSWLEKQGEQNKNYLKFKVGDEIIKKHNSDINKFGVFQITSIKDNKYWYNNSIICSIEEQNEWEFAEHNSNDKAKAEFKIGDWITFYGGKPFKILKVEAEQNGILDYLLLSQNGRDSYFNKKYVDTNARLWTIEDAKDGDVLKEDSCTFIIERMKPDGTAIVRCCLFDDGDFDLGSTLSFDVDSTYPATKEQRDTLERAMINAGYRWNKEELKLEKI